MFYYDQSSLYKSKIILNLHISCKKKKQIEFGGTPVDLLPHDRKVLPSSPICRPQDVKTGSNCSKRNLTVESQSAKHTYTHDTGNGDSRQTVEKLFVPYGNEKTKS